MKILLGIMMLMISIPLTAQSLPDSPKPHLDKWEWGMLAADEGVRAMDTITTRHFMTDPCHCFVEASNFNWIAKSTPRTAVYDAAVPVFYWFIARELTIHHHPKLAHIVAGFDLVYDGSAVVRNIHADGF
jgi:hypothetical protein